VLRAPIAGGKPALFKSLEIRLELIHFDFVFNIIVHADRTLLASPTSGENATCPIFSFLHFDSAYLTCHTIFCLSPHIS